MSRRERFVVGPADTSLRLDQLLAARIPELSRRKARTLLDIGGVFVDGARVKVAGRTLRRGQRVEVHLGGALERAAPGVGSEARARDAAALPEPVIVFEDDDLWVVDKPAALLTAPTPESDRGNLVDLLARRPGAPRALVVHRLDLGTSGLLVVAKTELANRALAERFRVHDVARSYEAVVAGAFPDAVAQVEEPIGGKRALTRFAVVERFADAATRLRCTLETGRTHQIRLHTRHVGHAVLGDARHGVEVRSALPPPPRMALHARTLGFVHPRSGQALSFERDWPQEMAGWLAEVRALTAPSPDGQAPPA